MTLRETLAQRRLVLDGAMGTMIQSYNLSEADFRRYRADFGETLQRGNNDLLCLSRPDVVADIHRRYVEAGADIVTTNTFNAQRISLSDYHCAHLVREINLAATRLARESGTQFVAGSVGPTNKTLSMSPNVEDPAFRAITFDQLAEAYQEQMEALIEGGVDALLIETCFDTLNAKAALYAAEEAMEKTGRRVELMVSATIASGDRLLSGQSLADFLTAISHAPLLSVGLNCSFGAREMLPLIKRLSEISPFYISAHPNAGLPNALGAYDQTPERMAEDIKSFLPYVNIIGGCCGTTDEHIKAIKAIAPLPAPPRGRENTSASINPSKASVTTSPLGGTGEGAMALTLIGERCNVAGSRKFLRLIKEHNYEEALQIARSQIEAGAQVTDVNLDDAMLDSEAEMVHLLNLMASDPDIAAVPIMIDSSKWSVIRAGLRCLPIKGIVNSLSLKEGEDIFIERAREVHRMGAALVVMAFDEKGQATTTERRIEVCSRAYKILTERVGFPADDIIFDPNVLSVATGMEEHDDYAASFLRAVEWIHQNLPGCHISGGISNLSFSFRGNNPIREMMHSVFIAEGRKRGMDYAIVNPSTMFEPDTIPMLQRWVVEDVILNRFPGAAERLIELAQAPLNPPEGGKNLDTPSTKNIDATSNSNGNPNLFPPSGGLRGALLTGNTAHLEAAVKSELERTPRAVDIIQGPMMDAMAEVGRRFGEGKMFLPQVVKSARAMKQAVALLEPLIKEQNVASENNGEAVTNPTGRERSSNRRRVLLATVKGDVHDIGKNIVAVVMACNGWDVIDLGVMVPAEDIVKAALEHHPDAIGLSGLITPSLDEMINVVSQLQEAGITAPIMIGGATTSALHTALKIAPQYSGAVLWIKDASQNVTLAEGIITGGTTAIQTLHHEQESLRKNAGQQQLTGIDEARSKRLELFAT